MTVLSFACCMMIFRELSGWKSSFWCDDAQRGFGIADTSDTMAILKRIKKRHDYTMEAGVARSRISKLKAKSTDVKIQNGIEKQEFDAIYEEYQDTLNTENYNTGPYRYSYRKKLR